MPQASGRMGVVVGGRVPLVLALLEQVLVGGDQEAAVVAAHEVRQEDEQLAAHHGAAVVGQLQHGPGHALLDAGHLVGQVGDAQEGGHGVGQGGAHLDALVAQQGGQLDVGALADAAPLALGQVLPQLADAQGRPLAQQRVVGRVEQLQAVGHDVGGVADQLARLVAAAQHGQDEGAHGLVLADVDDGQVLVRPQDGGEVVVAAVLDQVLLARQVDGQHARPDEDHDGLQLVGGRLQQLEHVGEDADAEGQLHGPGAQVQEAAQQHQGAHAVLLAEQHLQHDGQLLGHLAGQGVAAGQVDLEGGQLLGEEAGVDVLVVQALGLLALQQGQLGQRHVDGQVPAGPQRVAAGVGQRRVGLRLRNRAATMRSWRK
ncbi:hypothetical protein VTK73DRAFT_5670 [Phialemonium thermophilum]|uniref:Uncharacterized protein n=1 Tax=Phialemonium thermophilum TaxID=223376 RepID=A0ABR3V0U2_9PEZI